MIKQLTMKEANAMLKSGVSPEVFHTIHGDLITCSICMDQDLSNWFHDDKE